jgi:hypothetical protein
LAHGIALLALPPKNSDRVLIASEQASAPQFFRMSPTDLFNPLHESLLFQKQYAHKAQLLPKNRKRTITFCESVRVKKIPSHRDMDQADKSLKWISGEEQVHEVRRNTMEYLADGSDWRQAKEEDQFKSLPSGKLIHPFWFPFTARSQRSAYRASNKVKVTATTESTSCASTSHHAKRIVNAAA